MKENTVIKTPYLGIFNDGFPPIYDGVTLTVLNYVNILNEKGYPTCVVTPSNPEAETHPYEVIRYFSLPIRSRRPYRYGYPKLDFHIWNKLRSTPFRLVHSHSPFSSGRLAYYVKRKQGVPLIGTFHSKYRSDLKHSFRYAPWCVPIIMKRILDFYNACDQVWIPQPSVEETIRQYGFKGHVEVVENGIDYCEPIGETLQEFKQEAKQKLQLDDGGINLLFVGQHIWEKGIATILEALDLLRDKLDYRMNFIGDGYARKELESKIKELGLDDRIKVNGMILDREQLKTYYAASDIFLFPSYYDNAPLVVREAASMGTPAIVPVGSTASEVINDDVNGFLSQSTPQAYAKRILKISGDMERLLDVGLNARNTLVRNWDDVMEEVLDRYKVLMK